MTDGHVDSNDFLSLKQNLIQQVPSSLKNTVPNAPSKDETQEKINEYNANKEAKRAVIGNYKQSEEARLERQPRLMSWVVGLTSFQLVVFNIVIAFTGWFTLKNGNVTVAEMYFDILKYYIGATVAELIGMIWFVTKGTFSSDHIKTIDHMVNTATSSND